MHVSRHRAIGQSGKSSLGWFRPKGEAASAVWGIADQALISLASFVTLLLLARSLAPGAFGTFVVLYMVLLFAGSLQTTLVTRPHNVLAAPMLDDDYEAYTGGVAAWQLLLALGFCALALAAAGVAFLTGVAMAPMILALAAVLLAGQLQEFARQTRYTRRRANEAFVVDLVRYGGGTAVIVLLWRLDTLDGELALYSMAVAAGVSALVGFREMPVRLHGCVAMVRRNWAFGKWLLGDSLGEWLSTELYPLLVAAIVGLGGTGVYKMAQNVLAPTHMIFSAFSAYAIPRAARSFARGGRPAMLGFLLPAAIVAAVPLVAYLGVVGLAGGRLVEFLYPQAEPEVASLLWLFCLCYLVQHLVDAEVVALLAAGNTRAVFIGRAVAAVLTLTLGVGLVWRFGVYGSLVALLLTLVARFLVLGWRLSRSRSSDEVARTEEAKRGLLAAGSRAGA
jgi:O-antigen/teichoic acid export membrane protein